MTAAGRPGGRPGIPWAALPLELTRQALEFQRKAIKTADLVQNPPKIEVGATPASVVWQDGNIRLLRYTPLAPPRHATPLLIIYALVNKPYILDLQPDRSVVRRFLEAGFEVYLIDWGTPGAADRYRTIADYVEGSIDSIVEVIRERTTEEKVSILGYCMGGSLSVMYAALHPEKVANLMCMAAPLDWTQRCGLLEKWSDPKDFPVDRLVDTLGNIPADFLNGAFLLLDPVRNLNAKYVNLIERIDNQKFVENFLRMEKWIADGIPVAGETFREFIKWGYQENRLLTGRWEINGQRVDPKAITMPVLTILAEKDTLVPPEQSRRLTDVVGSKDTAILTLPSGHIGLAVSGAAHHDLWPKVIGWLAARSGATGTKAKKRPKKSSSRRTSRK